MNSLWDGFNKRKFPRLHLTCEVAIQPVGKQKAFTASTEDVGMGGVSVLLPEPLERFDRCNKTAFHLRLGRLTVLVCRQSQVAAGDEIHGVHNWNPFSYE